MSLNQNEKKSMELSFTQKCIMVSNILYEKDKLLLNSFDFIPLVKLYTSNMRKEKFNYTKIKGGLVIFQDKEKPEKNYHIRIYDSKDYSIQFNLEINKETKKNYIKLEPNFYCFNLKMGCIGFLFGSDKEAEKFKSLLINGPDPKAQDEFNQFNYFKLKDSDNIFLDVIDLLMADMEKKYEVITYDKMNKSLHEINQYLIFSGFLDQSKLLCNTQFDYEDHLFNIYVDRKYPKKIFYKMFHNFNLDYFYPFRPIYDDSLIIQNKSNYIDLLVNHLVNNFKEEVFISKKRKEHMKKEKNTNIGRESSTAEKDAAGEANSQSGTNGGKL